MRRILFPLGCLSLGLAVPASAAVTLGQVDTFEDGTTQGWTVNLLGLGVHPAPPANVATGGPGGADDNFLLLTAFGGSGPGSRLTAANLNQWAGNYLSAGVGTITMSVNNLGASDLSLRLLFEDPALGPPENEAISTEAILVAAGGGWRNIVFRVTPADLTAIDGSVTNALSGTTVLRLYHSTAAGFPGEPAAGLLGVDNIRALAAIPEPGTWASMIVGFGAVGMAMRRRAKRRQLG
jgi:hypothetical protein